MIHRYLVLASRTRGGERVAKTLYYTCMQHHLLSEDLETFDTNHIIIIIL